MKVIVIGNYFVSLTFETNNLTIKGGQNYE